MKRNAEGRIDLSLGGLVPASKPKPSTSQPAVSSHVQANREAEVSRAATLGGSSRLESPSGATAALSWDVQAARFEGLDPFTRSLIEQNPLAPKIQPKDESAKPKAKSSPAQAPQPQLEAPKPRGGSLDGLFMMLGAALATGAGGVALAKAKPAPSARVVAQPTPSSPAPASRPQPNLSSPPPAFHIPTR